MKYAEVIEKLPEIAMNLHRLRHPITDDPFSQLHELLTRPEDASVIEGMTITTGEVTVYQNSTDSDFEEQKTTRADDIRQLNRYPQFLVDTDLTTAETIEKMIDVSAKALNRLAQQSFVGSPPEEVRDVAKGTERFIRPVIARHLRWSDQLNADQRNALQSLRPLGTFWQRRAIQRLGNRAQTQL